jgi:PAS domain S-box-containing protein
MNERLSRIQVILQATHAFVVPRANAVNVSELIGKSLLQMRSDAIVAADRDGIICFWNPGAERIFGHAAADAIGHSLDLIIPGRLRDGIGKVIAAQDRKKPLR